MDVKDLEVGDIIDLKKGDRTTYWGEKNFSAKITELYQEKGICVEILSGYLSWSANKYHMKYAGYTTGLLYFEDIDIVIKPESRFKVGDIITLDRYGDSLDPTYYGEEGFEAEITRIKSSGINIKVLKGVLKYRNFTNVCKSAGYQSVLLPYKSINLTLITKKSRTHEKNGIITTEQRAGREGKSISSGKIRSLAITGRLVGNNTRARIKASKIISSKISGSTITD